MFIISADCLQFPLSVQEETRSNFEFLVIKMRLVYDRVLSVWQYREKSELHNYIDNHILHCTGGSIIGSILRRFEGPPRYNSQAEEIYLPFNPYASSFYFLVRSFPFHNFCFSKGKNSSSVKRLVTCNSHKAAQK